MLDDIVPKVGRPPAPKDGTTATLLATGEATMAQIAQLFETDAKTLPKRMKGVVPRGTRNGYKVYKIREAAAMLVTPGYEIEEYIRQMSPQELPPLLQKEFWNSQIARQKYEREIGNYWTTAEVIEYLGELGNTIRMTLLLVADDVNRESSLTELQQEVFQRITDAAITKLRNNIRDKFKDYHANRPAPGGPTDDGDDGDDDFNIAASDEDEDDDDAGNILASEDDEEEDIGI